LGSPGRKWMSVMLVDPGLGDWNEWIWY
jgi:hypothetical protein